VARYERVSGIGRNGTWNVIPREIPGYAASGESVRAVVTLDDIGTELLFTASEPLGVALTPRGAIERRNVLAGGVDQQIRILNKQPGPIQYEFASRIGSPTRAELEAIGDPDVPPQFAAAYLQRAESLSPEFSQLAHSVAGDAPSRIDKVDAVMKHLAGFDYTTEQSISARVAAGADPVEGFVFDTQRGHCEYFATAMALMLREVGVPTRNVNGYYGAHYNEMGDFYAVRQADAHSWVEVYFDGLGWVTFDPTPPAGRTAGDGAGFFPAGAKAVEALRNAYLNYVIDYDLGKQLEVLEQMGVNADRNELRVKVDWARLSLWVGSPILLGAIAIVILRRRRRRRLSSEARIYLSLLADLERRGHVREPAESAHRFAQRIGEKHMRLGAALRRFAEVYEAIRFGPRTMGGGNEELGALAREVRDRARDSSEP
jgi:transglutaminase-like putative cysteine protease